MATTPHNRPRPAARLAWPEFPADERDRSQRDYVGIFNDGARCGFCLTFPGAREPNGFPCGFSGWPRGKRHAWLSGFDTGLHDRLRLAAEAEAERSNGRLGQ
jgi:hypothetical protein